MSRYSNAHLLAETIHVGPTDQPTPHRGWDFAAHFDSYSGADDDIPHLNPVGYGATKFAAVLDLLEQVETEQ